MVARGVAFSRNRTSPIPPSFLPRHLPAVIVMRKLSFPSQFSIGPFVTDRATKLQSPRSALASTPGFRRNRKLAYSTGKWKKANL